MKKLLLAILIGLGLAGTAYAVTVFNSNQVGFNPQNGYCLATNGIISTWVASCGSGGGSSATTTIFSNATSTGPTFIFATGTTIGLNLDITGSGSTVTFSPQIQAGFSIPLTASTTQWNNFFNSPVTFLTAGSNIALSSTSTIAVVPNPIFTNTSTTNFTLSNVFYTPSMSNGCLQVSSGIATSTGVSCGSGSGGSGTISTSTNLTAPFLPIITGASTLGNSSLSQSAGTTLINGVTPIIDGGGDWLNNVIQSSGANIIVQAPTSTAIFGNLIQSGGVTFFQATTYLTAAQFCSGGLFNIASTTAVNVYFPTLAQQAAAPCGGTAPYASDFAQQFGVNSGSSSYTINASGSGETLLFAAGSGPTIYSGQTQNAIGQFVATSTISGATSTGMTFNAYLNTYQPTSTAPSTMGQILAADQTGHGWALTNLVAGSNITITTSTAGQITIASTASGSGSGIASTTPFTNGHIPYATSTLALTDSPLIANGLVVGMNATSSTIGFNIQGTGGTNTIFNVASSSATSIFEIQPNLRIGISSTTPTGMFVVQGTNLGANTSTPIFIVATSTGVNILTVLANGNVGIGSSSPTSNLVVQGLASQSTAILTIASSTGAAYLTVTPASDATLTIASSTSPNYYFKVNNKGVSSSSTVPTLSSCGTSPSIVGSNAAMVVTVGSVSATACTITFNPPFTNAPSVIVTNRSMSVVNAMTYTVSATATIISQTALTGDVLDIHAWGIGE